MRSPNYYRVRAIVRAVFWLSLLAGLYLISSRLWWTDGLLLGSGVRTMSDKCDPLNDKFWNCPKCGKLNLGVF
jgi:hypothetical protein